MRVEDERGNQSSDLNVWSSGMWISTATGSSAAIQAAGGTPMDPLAPNLQYMVREHLVDNNAEVDFDQVKQRGHGMLSSDAEMHIRWNSQVMRYKCVKV